MKAWLIALFLCAPAAADAMPILDCLVYQDGGASTVVVDDSNPLVGPTLPWDQDFSLVYGIRVTGNAYGSLATRMYINDQLRATFERSLLQDVSGDGRVVYMISGLLTECCYQPQAARIDVDMTGFTTRSFNFQVQQPVPEPASLLLLGTGLSFVARRKKWCSSISA